MGSVTPDLSLPSGAWDSHVHVFDEDRFPMHPSHPYHPKRAALDDLLRFQAAQGIEHVCLVAFSVYHTDNSSMLDALARLGGKARAVVCIDPDTVTEAELLELHAAGARGVRLNLHTRGVRLDEAGFRRTLTRHADRIRHLGWALQLYVSLDQIPALAGAVRAVAGTGIAVVIDHLGEPDAKKGPVATQPGYAEFMELLRAGLVYTKLGGVYRFESTPALDEYVMEVLRTAPDRVVWESDWPHSGGVSANPHGDRHALQDYRKIDDPAWVARCKDWCRRVEGGTGERLMHKIWVGNPRRLWQYDADD